MNLSTLKTFAPDMRRALMEAVARKLDYVLSADTADLRAAAQQVASLRRETGRNRDGLVERVAYTWFNRLTALRFLDARGWHRFGARVLTPATLDETQPELLKLLRSGALPAELAPYTNLVRLNALLDGRLPTAIAGADPQGEVYRQLILAACRFYHAQMPFLFESIDDESELLLPDDLLTEQSVAQGFRDAITDADCAEVEVLGWLYQFYISEKKDQVMARRQAVPSEDISAVTQLFTPHWIVRYLVENSLGRLWLHSRPGSALKARMPYYIDDPEGQVTTDNLTVAGPEEIKLIDPACGSGHMLTYAFDLLYAIYEEEGYAAPDIPGLILKNNLHGLEICPRATQLSLFALLCKAREKTRTAFREPVQPRVICLQDVLIDDDELAAWLRAMRMPLLFNEDALAQLHQFRENTSTFGALIQPILSAEAIASLKHAIGDEAPEGELFLQATHSKIRLVLDQAEMLTQQYHIVVANPPYMGSRQFPGVVTDFVAENYITGKSDLFAAFLLRGITLCPKGGFIGFITLPSWLFLSSFENLRQHIIESESLISLIHVGRGLWGSDFGSCAFIVKRQKTTHHIAIFLRLFTKQGSVANPAELEQRFFAIKEYPRFNVSPGKFCEIPGCPIAYWVSDNFRHAFRQFPKLGSIAEPRQGLASASNERFLKYWHEVCLSRTGYGISSIEAAISSGKRWFPHSKGGAFRKWYGNNEYVVDWENDGQAMRNFDRAVVRNSSYYFREGVTWSHTSIASFSVRYSPPGFTFNCEGPTLFSDHPKHFLAFMCSKPCFEFMAVMNPTLHFLVGTVSLLPVAADFMVSESDHLDMVSDHAIQIARSDWDNSETSWDFLDQPMLRSDFKKVTLDATWRSWSEYLRASVTRMQNLETENNQLWIEAFGLQEDVMPEVPEMEITLARPDARKDIAAFLSYAVGCMMGRYSLDEPGLILADAGATLQDYMAKLGRPLEEVTFTPDGDGIIPVLDGEWFEDDIVARARAFLRVTFGEASLADNLRFLEASLGKDLRGYFVSQFYKDHVQTYKKRPIYWLFQSPKKGFQCLIYMHRYTRDTVNLVLNRYLREYLSKLRARIDQLEAQLPSENLSGPERTKARKESEQLKKTLRECEDWERDVLLPLAQQRVEIDLDDGVKVNYLKFGAALAPIAGLEAREEE